MKNKLLLGLFLFLIIPLAQAHYMNNTLIDNVGLNTTINVTYPWNFSELVAVDGEYIYLGNFSNSNPLAVSAETLSWNLTDENRTYTGLQAPYFASSNYLFKQIYSGFDGWLGGGLSELSVASCAISSVRTRTPTGGFNANLTSLSCANNVLEVNLTGFEPGTNNITIEYICSNVTLAYEPLIIEGAIAAYSLTLNSNSSLCTLSNAKLVYNGSTWPAATDDNLTYSYTKAWPMVGTMNNTFYWQYNITDSMSNVYTYVANGTQDIAAISVTGCGNFTNVTALYLSVLSEDYLSTLTGANIWGTITYYASGHPESNKTYSFGGLNYTAGYTLSGTTDTENFPTSSAATGDYETNFRVLQPSIITRYIGTGASTTCSGVAIEIYKGACGSADLLASGVATAVPNYKFSEDFDVGNYTEVLVPGLDYCVKLEHGPSCNLYYHASQSYSGSIISVSSENVGHNEYMRAQAVSQDAVRVCMSPAWASFNYDAYFQHRANVNSYIQRWYIENGTISNASASVFMYNFPATNTTKTDTMTLYQNSYSTMQNVLSHLVRYYAGEDTWRVVQMEKTDATGKANWHVREEDTDYKLRFYQNGVLLRETNTLHFKCPVYTDCVFDVSIIGETGTYHPIFEDIWYYIYPDYNSLTALTNSTLGLHVLSANAQVDWFAIYTVYNGSLYKTNLSTASGGWANITLPLHNVTEPEQLYVYYKIKHLTKGTYSTLRIYHIYPHASNPSFYNAMMFISEHFSTFWLMMFAALVTIGLVGSVLQFGSFGFAPLGVLTLVILGVFVYFRWFSGWLYALIALPVLYLIFVASRGGE